MPFCPISGKPVALNNPVKTLVLSVDGEPQHFCCPGHEKRYLRENPGARKVTLHVPLDAKDLRGRHIPERYLAGLPPALRAVGVSALGQLGDPLRTESRDAYGTGDFSELKTDVKARELGLVKKSKYRVLAEERGFDVSQVGSYEEMIDAAVDYYAGRKPTAAERSRAVEGLKKVYAKGLAAWKSGGHRPGATAKNWADARIASLLVGGKGPRTADKKEFAMLPADVQAAIWQQAPDIASM